MPFLERKNNKAFKKSINNPDLIFSNFLPINNANLFDEFVQYIQNHIDNGNGKDVSTLRQEKNGTLVLEFIKPEVYLKLYSNEKGYVRFRQDGIDRILNWDIKVNDVHNYFYGEVEVVKTLEKQLNYFTRYLIFNS